MTVWTPSTMTEGVSYPVAPWELTGSVWLTLFRLAEPVDRLRPAGVYAAAFVSYDEDSALTYSELLVARPRSRDALRRGGDRRVTITDIRVDSPASVAGGRELWAIPKELCDFALDASRAGPLSTTEWSATVGRTPIATARFRDVSRAAVRLPFRAHIWQPGIPDTGGEDRTATVRGSARCLPARARWDINPEGPLGWLDGARQLASLRQVAFRASFG